MKDNDSGTISVNSCTLRLTQYSNMAEEVQVGDNVDYVQVQVMITKTLHACRSIQV